MWPGSASGDRWDQCTDGSQPLPPSATSSPLPSIITIVGKEGTRLPGSCEPLIWLTSCHSHPDVTSAYAGGPSSRAQRLEVPPAKTHRRAAGFPRPQEAPLSTQALGGTAPLPGEACQSGPRCSDLTFHLE